MTRLSENSVFNVKNKSYSLTAEIDVPDGGANGTIIAQGGLSLYVDGVPAGKGRIDATEALTFSLDETTDVGGETGTTVGDDYTTDESRFTGTIEWIRLEAGLDSHDHLIDPEDLAQIAMTRQ